MRKRSTIDSIEFNDENWTERVSNRVNIIINVTYKIMAKISAKRKKIKKNFLFISENESVRSQTDDAVQKSS